MSLKALGKKPLGEELEKIKASPNYVNDVFKNIEHTELFQGESMTKVLWKFMTKKNTTPPKPIPSIKTDLKNLPSDYPVIVWFGHSSYLLKINGKHILVDPVFSGHASPFSFTTKSFAGTDIYSTDDLPGIDLLLITHDHYDHLDYETVIQLKSKVKKIATSLGVASHLQYWGFDTDNIIEFDWWNEHIFFDDLKLTAVPARHFSGRTLVRNKTLWSAFVLQTGNYNLFLGGDSGYGNHFKKIHEKFSSFDIAILECGQYNTAWHDIHMLPEETVSTGIDLNAKILLPVHWGKFSLSLHTWDEPIKRVTLKAKKLNVKMATPMIGEPVILNTSCPNKEWWKM